MLRSFAVLTTIAFVVCAPVSVPAVSAATLEAMLRDFVQDYQHDPVAATPVTFGIRVKDAEPSDWHVVCTGKSESAEQAGVTLHEGFPETPSLYFVTDLATLTSIHEGRMASLTAMGKAKSSDFAPLDLDAMEGVEPTPELIDHLVRVSFHFWTRGFPEIVRFGDLANTREVHGANATLFYYQKGFRSGWFNISKGQHVNRPKSEQTNPFPSMLIITRGRLTGKIGGKEMELSEGEAIYIGPGITHEFWNTNDAAAQGVLVMFGEGA